MLERCSPRYVPGVVDASRTEKEEHPGKPQNPTGSPMGKHQSDRMQVMKTPDRAVGSLGHLGYLTTHLKDEAAEWRMIAVRVSQLLVNEQRI